MITHFSDRSLYAKITQLGRAGKLLGSALKKARVPPHLHEDAKQEILHAWLLLEYDGTLSDGEISSYADKVGFTAALRYRRDMGGPVRLPGSAFRKRSDGSTYVQPGHLADPLQWEDLAEIFCDEGEASANPENVAQEAEDGLGLVDWELVGLIREHLSERQLLILEMLEQGHSFATIADKLRVTPVTIQRNLRNVRQVLLDHGLTTPGC